MKNSINFTEVIIHFQKLSMSMVKLLLLLTIFFVHNAKGQENIMNPYLVSGEANQLLNMAEVPVSHATGVASYPLHLYTYTDGDIKIPISLNYYASGVKPDEHPGWTGLNWQLKAGGSITRLVKDLPDDYDVNTLMKKYDFDILFPGLGYKAISGERAGYYFHQGIIPNTNNWYSGTNIKKMVEDNLDTKDTEPDKFVFSFAGYSGEFYLDGQGNWIVRSDSDIKVVFNENNFVEYPTLIRDKPGIRCLLNQGNENVKTFGGFTLITPDGYEYIFGVEYGQIPTDDALASIEYSIPFFAQYTSAPVAVSWKLAKIKSPTGKIADFSYQRRDFTADFRMSFDYTTELFLNKHDRYLCGTDSYRNYNFGENNEESTRDYINPRFASIDGSLIYPSYLKNIKGAISEIDFNIKSTTELFYPREMINKNREIQRLIPIDINQQICIDDYSYLNVYFPYLFDNQKYGNDLYYGLIDIDRLVDNLKWYQLDEIIIKSDLSDIKKTIKFDYTSEPDSRLMLKHIEERALREVINEYSFEYYGENQGLQLPEYISEKIDHWGFYNNSTIGRCFTKKRIDEDYSCAFEENYRAPTNDINIAQLGSLKRVTLPTGGSVIFEYGLNTYSKKLSADRLSVENLGADLTTGGIRIERIVYKDQRDNISGEKEYTYMFDGNSSGLLDGEIKYVFTDITYKTLGAEEIIRVSFGSQNYAPNSVNFSGSHIGYSVVKETINNEGYNVYYYTNFDTEDGHYDFERLPSTYNLNSPYLPVNSRGLERGKLKLHKVYDKGNNLLVSTELKYKETSFNYIKGIQLTVRDFLCNQENQKAYTAFPYKIFIYDYNIEKKISSYENNSIVKIEEMDYLGGDNSILSHIETGNSDNKVIAVDYKNAFSICKNKIYTSTNNPEIQALWEMYNSNNMNNWEEIRKIKKGNDWYVTGGNITLFRQGSKYNTTKDDIYPYAIYQIKTDVIIPEGDFNAISLTLDGQELEYDYRYELISTFEDYDAYGNPIRVRTRDGIVTEFEWGSEYNYSYPTTKIVNPNTESQEITQYTYKPLAGVLSQTDVNDRTTYYEYDNFGRIISIKDKDGNVLKHYEYQYRVE